MKMSALMKKAEEAFNKGGQKAVDEFIKSLSREDRDKLFNECIDGFAGLMEMMILADMHQEIESQQVIKGFSKN